jgi:hypothetical protein
MIEARETPGRGWAAKARAQLGTLLDCFAANPELAYFCLVAPPAAGGEVAAAHRRFLDTLMEQLFQGRPKGVRRTPAATEYFIAGGLASLIVEAVEAQTDDAIPTLLPELVRWVLAPYLGWEIAAAAAA